MSGHSSTQAVLVFMKLILSQSWFYLTHSIMINKCDLVMLIREGFKNKKKLVEYSTKGLTPPPPPLVEKKFYWLKMIYIP